jgi:hypothetical protein
LDPSKILPLEYLDFINTFSKAKTDILPEYDPNNFFFILKDKTKYKNPRKYLFILPEDKKMRDYVTTYLSKGFIIINSAPQVAPILFVKKPGNGICFYIDYYKLNTITKKNIHLIPLIKETLIAINRTVIISELDI